MRIDARLDKVEAMLDEVAPTPPREAIEQQNRVEVVLERWLNLVDAASEQMEEADRERVYTAVKEAIENRSGPLGWWLWDLINGRSRMPLLSTNTMTKLLFGWLHPKADNYHQVCESCGLAYPSTKQPPLFEQKAVPGGTCLVIAWPLLPGKKPFVDPPPWYDLFHIFEDCPNCGEHRFDWSHLVDDKPKEWKKLDGWAGNTDHTGFSCHNFFRSTNDRRPLRS